MPRTYELKKRAERMAETRRRIVQAAVDLHTTIGPAATSLSAVAERAGVQRHTLYAHFRDLPSLFDACSAHWEGQHPQPDFTAALTLDDPAERLTAVLAGLYGWYEQVADHVILFERDSHLYPELWGRRDQALAELADALASGLGPRRVVRAAVGHAVAFRTWHSLVRGEGLTSRQAAHAMVALAGCA